MSVTVEQWSRDVVIGDEVLTIEIVAIRDDRPVSEVSDVLVRVAAVRKIKAEEKP